MSIFDLHKDGLAPDSSPEDGAAVTQLRQRFNDAMKQEDWREAYRLYKQLPDDKKQHYIEADDIYPLAKYAADERQSEDALAIVEGFSKRYPEHHDVVKNYLIAAKVMQTQFGEREQAQALLTRLENYYADHSDAHLIAEVKKELQ